MLAGCSPTKATARATAGAGQRARWETPCDRAIVFRVWLLCYRGKHGHNRIPCAGELKIRTGAPTVADGLASVELALLSAWGMHEAT